MCLYASDFARGPFPAAVSPAGTAPPSLQNGTKRRAFASSPGSCPPAGRQGESRPAPGGCPAGPFVLLSYHILPRPARQNDPSPFFCPFRGTVRHPLFAFPPPGKVLAQQGAAPLRAGCRADFFLLFSASALPSPPALSVRRAFAPPDPSRWSGRRGAGR